MSGYEEADILDPARRALRACIAVLAHLFLTIVFVTGVRILAWVLTALFGDGGGPLMFGRWPLGWMFDAMDISICAVFVVLGVLDAYRTYRG